MTVIYTFILLVISNYLGSLLLKNTTRKKLKMPVGFFAFQFLLQLGYYLFQYYRLSSDYIHIVSLVITVPLLVLGILEIRKEDFSFLKKKEFYILFTIIFVLIKIIPDINAGDDWFYFPFIRDNSNISKLYLLNPRTGIDTGIDNIYRYQGYYLFLGSLYQLHDLLFNDINSVFIVFRTTMSLTFVCLTSIFLSYIKDYLNVVKKDNRKYFLIILGSILLVGLYEWSHIYVGSFALFPLAIPLYMMLLNEFVENNDKRVLLSLLAINGGMLAISSSALFLSTFITICYALYSSLKQKLDIKDYFNIMIPNFIYLVFFIDYPKLLWIILLTSLIINFSKANNFISKTFEYISKYLILILPVLLFLASVILKLDFNWDQYRTSYTILYFNLIMVIWCLYRILIKKDADVLHYIFTFYILIFFNPFVAPIISKFLTTSDVYHRLFFITKNPFIIIYLLYDVFKYFKMAKNVILRNVSVIISLVLIFNYGRILISRTLFNPDYFKSNYNYILRSDNDSNDLGKYLSLKGHKDSKVLSIHFAPREYSSDYITKVYRYPGADNVRDDIVIKVLYRNEYVTLEEFELFKNKVFEESFNYIIVMKKNIKPIEELMSKYFTLEYENETYILYVV